MDYDLSIKVLLLGDRAVGKSSFLSQLVDSKFSAHEQPTLGVEFKNKILKMKIYNKGYTLKCQVWDTSGLKRLEHITKKYYNDCAIIFIFYDITNKQSFSSISDYISYIKSIYQNIRVIIIGTKNDLNNFRTVGENIATKFAYSNNFNYYELSCKNNVDVNKIFRENINKLVVEYLSESSNKIFQGIKKGSKSFSSPPR